MTSLNLWFNMVKENLPRFIEEMKSDKKGKYRFAYEGDYEYGEKDWGLANTVYATKLMYMLNSKNLLEESSEDIHKFILKFSRPNGEISDNLIKRQSIYNRVFTSIKTRDLNNLLNEQTRRAETRQSTAALLCLGQSPKYDYKLLDVNKQLINSYFDSLDWTKPYGAGSHFSHLLFFLNIKNRFFNLSNNKYKEYVKFALQKLESIHRNDGFWYKGKDPGHVQRINGCMKILTGLQAVDKMDNLGCKNSIIDGCLSWSYSKGACDNFDIIYPLYHCSLNNEYRIDEVKKLAIRQAHIFKLHYFEKYGGFSFFLNRSNHMIYGAKFSRGLNTPDIHGTLLYFWGIVLISKILEIDLDLRDQIN